VSEAGTTSGGDIEMIRYGLTAAFLMSGLAQVGAGAPTPSIVVTTSMIEEAVRELGEAAEGVEVVRLLPPGSCPGHFDLSPRAVPSLRDADAIVRHGFQGVLESKLHDAGVEGAAVVVADIAGSLLVPDNYLGLVRRMAEILGELVPERSGALTDSVDAVARRLDGLEGRIRGRPDPWQGARVIASFQQAGFSRWLGLEVLAEIGRPEDVTPRDLEQLLQFSPDLVVGNLQEGVESAAAVAERLQVPLVVFSNFPGADGYGEGYDQLLQHNLDRLDEAWMSR
jgi:ABC-type Zn uptake system ZnuABC Zn-binding protein ZnuA